MYKNNRYTYAYIRIDNKTTTIDIAIMLRPDTVILNNETMISNIKLEEEEEEDKLEGRKGQMQIKINNSRY